MKALPSFAALRLGLFALAGVLAANVVVAQISSAESARRYLVLGYMKPAPGKASDYVKLEREKWKLIHQDNVYQGRLTSWKLYAVSWPNGDDQEYDYVTVMEYPSFAHLDGGYIAANVAKVLGGENKFDELRAATGPVRQLRRNDTLALLLATDGWSSATNGILVVHFLRSLPGKSADLMKIQRDYYLPSNNDLIKAGGATAWATTAVRYPSQLDFPYTHVSFNGYASLAQMEKDAPQAWRDRWSAKAGEATKELPATRKRVKGQLWRLIDQTTPASTPRSGT